MGKLSFARNKHGGRALRGALAALLALGLLPGIGAGAAPAWAGEEPRTPEGSAPIEVSVEGPGSVTVVAPDGTETVIEEGDAQAFSGELGTFLEVRGQADAGTRALQRVTFEDLGQLAADDIELEGGRWTWWLTFDGTAKRAAYLFDTDEPAGFAGEQPGAFGTAAMARAAAALPLTARALERSADDPQVGDVYTGYGEITYVDIVSSGGGVGHFNFLASSGPLAGQGEYRTYCADHGAASLPKGAEIYYTFTVTSIDYDAGRVYGTLYGEGLGDYIPADGYQHMSAETWMSFDFGGELEIQKKSADEALTAGNRCYTFEGIKYGVYADAGCTSLAATLTLDASGYAKSDRIRKGTYWVKEIATNGSYALSDEVQQVEVGGAAAARVEVTDEPLEDPDGVKVRKYDADSGAFVPAGDAKLALAEYTFEYVDGYAYNTEQFDQLKSGSKMRRTWVMRTDGSGATDLRVGDLTFTYDGKTYPYKVSGDEFFRNDLGTTVPLGTVRIRETKAPEGYNLSDRTYLLRIVPSSDGSCGTVEGDTSTIDPNTGDVATKAEEQPARGGVTIYKRDAETGSSVPMGGTDWDGVAFEIVNRSAGDVTYGGVKVAPGEVVAVIRPDAQSGAATTGNGALQYGTYGIREAATSDGYLMSDTAERAFQIRSDGEMVVLDGDEAVRNQVKRGDFEFVKVAEATSQRMAGVPFLVTSDATGEAHVVVTDANGQVKTSSDWNAHSSRTNASDAAVDANGDGVFDEAEKAAVDEAKLDCYAGTWFGLHPETGDAVAPDDGLGALPWGTYTVEELRCAANKHYELVKTQVAVSRHGVTVDMGTIIDDKTVVTTPWIGTSARDGADGDRILAAGPDAAIVDRVEYANLDAGELYRLAAVLMDKGTGEPVRDGDGRPVTAEKVFAAADLRGFEEVTLSFDATALLGDVVVFEALYKEGSDDPVATHEDMDDYYQTVRIYPPRIGTSLADGADGDKQVVAEETVRLVDTVSYSNLVPGREHTVAGTLMVAGADGAEPAPLAVPATDGDGNALLAEDGEPVLAPVTAEATFTPESAAGTVEVVFEFPGSAIAEDMALVAYEKLWRAGAEIASHEDPADPNQTVVVVAPRIGTTATDGADGDKGIEAAASAVIDDAVAYENLVPGEEYVLAATVMVRTGEGEASPLLGADGAPCTVEHSFVPEAPSGTEVVSIEVDATELAGADLVMYELLLLDGQIKAAHEDPDDEGQTVHVTEPGIGTTATDASDGDHKLLPGKQAVIQDEVAYTGLVPGKEYVVKGVLMDKETGEPVRDAVGGPVAAEKRFTPNAAAGTVTVEFSFDASAMAGKTVVVFEDVYKDGKIVATHSDIEDAAQTVEIAEPLAKTGRGEPSPDGFFAKTGIDLLPIAGAAALLALAGGALALAARKKKADGADRDDAAA